MSRFMIYAVYAVFPLMGIAAALRIAPDKVALRLLVAVVISGLGVIAADAGLRPGDLLRAWRQRRTVQPGAQARRAVQLMAAAFALMILSAITFSPLNNRTRDFTLPVLLMLGGTIALWRSLALVRPTSAIAAPAGTALHPARSRPGFAAIGVLLLLVTGEIAGGAMGIAALSQVPLVLQGALFYSGIGCLVIGLGGVRRIALPVLPALPRPSLAGLRRLSLANRRTEIAVVIGITAGAFVSRAWAVDTGLRASVDEAVAIDGITHYYGGAIGLVERPSVYLTTLLMPQMQTFIIDALGRSVLSIRLASAILGALTVAAVYGLARDLFGDRHIGVIAALLLAAFPPHIHFSRIALLHIADPLCGTLALWFLVRGIRFNRRVDWALAGAMLGLTQYFFEAGRLFYIPLVGMTLIAALGIRLFTRIHLPWRGILIAGLALIFVAMPSYYATFSASGFSTPRLAESAGVNLLVEPFADGLTADETTQLVRRLLFPFTVYVHQPEVAVFYGGDQPLMLVYVVPFFLMGIGCLLWRWRTLGGLIVLWVLLAAASNALLRDSAVYARWHVVFPAIAIACAVALRWLVPMLWLRTDGDPPPAPQRIGLVVGALVAVAVVGQVTYYYRSHVPLFERQSREFKPYADIYDMAMRALALPDNTDIYLIGDPIPDIGVPRAWIAFLTESNPATLRYIPLASSDFTLPFIAGLPIDRNAAFFIDIGARDQIALMVSALGCTIESSPYSIDPPTKEFVLCFNPT